MTVMLIKNRARKPLCSSDVVNVGWRPNGVGGFPQKAPVVELVVGEFRLLIAEMEWEQIVKNVDKLRIEDPAFA